MSDELMKLDAVGQAALVRARELEPRELVDAAIARIERFDRQLNAVILPAFERARQRAKALTLTAHTSDEPPPFHGVPFLMKDLGGQEAGAPCHLGMRFLKQASWVERNDSYLAARLGAAGFISLGRTNTPELGLLPTTEPEAYGPTRNPWSFDHSAGGSSGGAGAAVAAGLVPAAHASDGGGSIRIPAAHCGLVGLKPTRGRSSFGPSAGERWAGFSCELVVSRSVRDTAAILDVTNGPMLGDPYAAAPPARLYADQVRTTVRPLRIGVLSRAPRGDVEVHPACAEAAMLTARELEGLGHHVEESFPEALADPDGMRAFVTIVACNIARALDAVSEKVGKPIDMADVEALTWALAELGRACGAPQYIAALEATHLLGRRLAPWWERFDLLLTPTTAQPAPRLGQLVPSADNPLEGYARSAPYGCFTAAFNQSGQPAISLPMHQTADRIPVGTQLVAAYGREDLLLRVAAQLEQARPWKDRWPALVDGG
jgi:amidase